MTRTRATALRPPIRPTLLAGCGNGASPDLGCFSPSRSRDDPAENDVGMCSRSMLTKLALGAVVAAVSVSEPRSVALASSSADTLCSGTSSGSGHDEAGEEPSCPDSQAGFEA